MPHVALSSWHLLLNECEQLYVQRNPQKHLGSLQASYSIQLSSNRSRASNGILEGSLGIQQEWRNTFFIILLPL